ncbi:MAG: hypothetical protein HY099_05225, partial [Nitrospirae bacterium]|nr:hypothetical protein [Nitrospirota bacterium]
AYTGDTEKTKKSLRFTMLLAVLLLLLFLSDMSLKIISTKKESSAVRDEIRKTYQGVFPNDRKITSELYQIKAHLKELKDKEAFFVGVSPLQFFLELASVSRRGISFSDITIDKERIIMKGESPSLSDVQQLKTSLERFLQEVSISDTKPLSQNRTIFTIAARGRAI